MTEKNKTRYERTNDIHLSVPAYALFTSTVVRNGRVTIPKPVRGMYEIKDGDRVVIAIIEVGSSDLKERKYTEIK